MADLLEITSLDIAQLDDAKLRELVGLLCEADYRLAGLPTKGITWGGHQDARDGGLDVVVRGEESPPKTSFIPRSNTGFQVKKPDMPRAEILKEMRPKDSLREEIKSLIQEGGAYIIVSSTGSTANAALKSRTDAMRDAVADEESHEDLYLDFLDRGRIATWVRMHPSLILWVRNKIGRQLTGWRPYGNWANTPDGIEEEYLLDSGLRLHDGTRPNDRGITVEDGLLKLRTMLSTPGTSVRLAGLSGVGKTRLVQALFDERVGKDALNRSLAFYADMADSPDPDPRTFAEQLLASGMRAILIVDNCPPDLHRRLTQTCANSQSLISLLTVEYDVRDDIPNETHVLRLEPASEKVIEELIRKRFWYISQVDGRTIANFSGGNARLAIALAKTVQQGETLSGFHDEELFERLFKQRNDPSESLLRSAEVCSLVYSFQGEDIASETAELKFLASLIDKPVSELYRDVRELRARDLIQARHVWRAVLPHAIANRLARRALESIPRTTLLEAFLYCDSERLITSFTRRLSFLHDCETAVEIVTEWLTPNGWIGKTNGNFNSFGMQVFRNIAPVAPEKTLEVIERAANSEEGQEFTSRENSHYYEFVRLLKHLAYDPALFTRSVKIMCRYALSEKPEENVNSTRNILQSLFYIHLSGTHASVETRANIIEDLVNAADKESQELGISLLDATLETWHFGAVGEFDFGARPRDFGFYPKSRQEVIHWFGTFIHICTELALSDRPIAVQARKTLSNHLRGLWTNVEMFDTLEEAAGRIHEHTPWNEGWLSVREIIRYDSKGFDKKIIGRLHRFEEYLRPASLLEKARTYALSDQQHAFDLEEDGTEGDAASHWTRIENTTRKIGIQVAQQQEILEILLPDLVSTYNPRLVDFGKGLAEGCKDKQLLWQSLYAQFKNTPSEKKQINVLLGFLSGCSESEPILYDVIMDGLVDDDLLGPWFPILQINTALDERGVQRLYKALDIGIASTYTYQYLAWGRKHEGISENDLADLLGEIFSKQNGADVAIEILKMRFHRTKEEEPPKYSEKLIATARAVLAGYPFGEGQKRYNNHSDFDLARIADVCLQGEEGVPTTITICRHLAQSISDYDTYFSHYPDLLNTIARLQPHIFLDVFFGSDGIKEYCHRRVFFHDSHRHKNPLDHISDANLIFWCEVDSASRYPLIVGLIETYYHSAETGKLEWRPIIYAILEKAPDLTPILDQLAALTNPTSWRDSRADLLQKRSVLFQNLFHHNNAEIRAWAKTQYSTLQEIIKDEREWEASRNRERNERFE